MTGDAKRFMSRGWGAMAWHLAVASFLLLYFAAPSSASPGVDTYWGNPTTGLESTGGRFSNTGPKQVAVYGATGDVYAADTGFHRIQQFDEDGGFIRAWGFDVSTPEAIPASSAVFETCVSKAQCKGGVATVSPALGGELSSPAGIAVDQSNGHVYVANSGLFRIEEFTSTGGFVRAFGLNVVASGSDQADEEQTLTVNATAGQYKLKFGVGGVGVGETVDIEWNAGASSVQSALEGISNIGAGNVAVTGGPGGPGGNTPYLIKFGGARADVNQSPITVAAALTGSAAIATVNEGAVGYEICNIAATCQTGTSGATGGALLGSGLAEGPALTIVPSGGTAPNAGNLLVAEAANKRVQEFAPTGQFVRTFGWEVVISGPDNKNFGLGQPDQANEVQKVVVKATGGKFKLTFPTGGSGPGVSETAELNYNASATEVEAALNAITNISTGGGSVVVTGGPGNATGSNPYVVTFNGGPRGGTNVAQIASPTPNTLTGGITTSAVLFFTSVSGNQGFEVCRPDRDICKTGGGENAGLGQFAAGALRSLAADPSGRIYTVEVTGTTTAGANPPVTATSGFRVQTFGLPGNVPTPQGVWLCEVLCGTNNGLVRDNTAVVITDDLGMVYAVKAFLNGTGIPPVVQPPSAGIREYQERILKIDPAGNGGLGQIVDTFNVNTGEEPAIEGDAGKVRIDGISSLSTASGRPFYMASPGSLGTSRSRIYRLDEISGPSGSVSTGTVGATAVTLNATINPAATLGPVKTLYRFEYRREGVVEWTRVPSADVDIGNGSAGGESDSCSSQLEAATCHISGEIDGLELGRTYQYRLIARTSYQGATFTAAPQEFTTEAKSPSVETGGAVWSGPSSTANPPSLTFNGRINPQGGDTTYVFEYVKQADFEASGFAKAETAPAAPISAGHGAKTVDVVVAKNGLDAASAYRFRLAAANSAGSSTGGDQFVAAPLAGDRFVELVSAGDSQGADVAAMPTISDDGERAAFTALVFGDDQQAAPWIVNPAIAQRGEEEWTAKAVAGDPLQPSSIGFDTQGGLGNSEVTQRLWGTAPAAQTVQLAVRTLDGALTPISPILSPLDRTGNFSLNFLGGSSDLSALVLSGSGSTLFPGEPLLSGGVSNLYKISGAGTGSPSVSLLNSAVGGGVIGGACGASVGAGINLRTNGVSADGSVVYFSARAGTPASGSCTSAFKMRIFKRTGDTPAVEIDQSQCARANPEPLCSTADGDDFYWGASADGSKVFFSSVRQLTNSDADSTEDLYLYDSSPPAGQPSLVQVSAGEATVGHTVGSGAEVRGVADFAMDGSRVYFVAKGRLTSDATAGANNLFVFQRDDAHPAGRIQFVATLASGDFQIGTEDDPRLWANVPNSTGGFKPAYALPRYEGEGGGREDGDGHVFIFVSSQSLVPAEDQDSVNDLYRYDDDAPQSERLACLSCTGDGALPVGIIGRDISSALPDRVQRERIASEAGSRVVFRTREQLLPDDTNAAEDVYLWNEGTLSLASSATAGTGVSYAEEAGGPAISPDGETVFFATRATLLPQDLDNGARDIYAARVDGGFAQKDTPVPCISDLECRGPGAGKALEAVTPATPGFTGSGNVKIECSKKQVLRGGRCVKKPKKHKANKHKAGKGKKKSRAGSGRRAGR